MPKKKLKLKIRDYRTTFNEPHKKNPYYLFVQWGNENFCFSNKQKAERWLVKFSNESLKILKELYSNIPFIIDLHLKNIHLLPFYKLKKLNTDLEWYIKKYYQINNSSNIEILVSKELFSVIDFLLDELKYFKKLVSTNNRNKFLLEKIDFKIASILRIKNDVCLLITNPDGIKKLSTHEQTEASFLKTVII